MIRPNCNRCKDSGVDYMGGLCQDESCEARLRRLQAVPLDAARLPEVLADLMVRVEALEQAEDARRTLAMEQNERL